MQLIGMIVLLSTLFIVFKLQIYMVNECLKRTYFHYFDQRTWLMILVFGSMIGMVLFYTLEGK